MRAVLNEGRIPALRRKIALVGVLWPSKKFAEEDGSFGGAAGAGSPAKTLEVIDQINGLRDVFPDRKSQKTLDSLVALVPQLEDQATARKKFADQLRSDMVNGEEGNFSRSAARTHSSRASCTICSPTSSSRTTRT